MTLLQAAGGSAPRDYAEALAWKKAGRLEIKEARQQAKALNFGLPGMMGVPKFRIYAWKSYRVRFTEEQAHELKALWLAEYVEQRPYWAWVDRATANGALQQFVSKRVRGRVSGPAAANTIFQGLAADGAKFAAVLLSAAGYTGEIPYDVPSTVQEAAAVYHGCRPVLFLHDEVIAEVPEEKATICAEAQSTIMKYAMTLHVPDVRIGCKPVLMRRWAKGIDPTYAADGTLIPTEVA
jgi:DNA polymerase-1